jgi:hypothetical protein
VIKPVLAALGPIRTALFYMLQCVVALIVAWQTKDLPRRPLRLPSFAFLAVICLLVLALGLPSDRAREGEMGQTPFRSRKKLGEHFTQVVDQDHGGIFLHLVRR